VGGLGELKRGCLLCNDALFTSMRCSPLMGAEPPANQQRSINATAALAYMPAALLRTAADLLCTPLTTLQFTPLPLLHCRHGLGPSAPRDAPKQLLTTSQLPPPNSLCLSPHPILATVRAAAVVAAVLALLAWKRGWACFGGGAAREGDAERGQPARGKETPHDSFLPTAAAGAGAGSASWVMPGAYCTPEQGFPLGPPGAPRMLGIPPKSGPHPAYYVVGASDVQHPLPLAGSADYNQEAATPTATATATDVQTPRCAARGLTGTAAV